MMRRQITKPAISVRQSQYLSLRAIRVLATFMQHSRFYILPLYNCVQWEIALTIFLAFLKQTSVKCMLISSRIFE